MIYEVILSPAAESDLLGIADYIRLQLQEPIVAVNLIKRLKKAVLSLETMPMRHPLAADEYIAAKQIRVMPAERYLIFYTVNESSKTVRIVRILYGKRAWQALL